MGRATLELSGPGRLVVGENTQIQDGVTVRLSSGSIEIGPRCTVRAGAVLNVSGSLTLEGDILVSWGAVIHCARQVYLSHYVTVSEYVTVVDSSHTFDDPDRWHWHQNDLGSVRIGRNTWLCSKSTVTKDVTLGSCVVVGAGSTVIGDVPDGVLVSGVPAEIVAGYRTTA